MKRIANAATSPSRVKVFRNPAGIGIKGKCVILDPA
jgi:hypothetical protein